MTPDGVVLGLIGANVAVFVLWRIADARFMRRHFMVMHIILILGTTVSVNVSSAAAADMACFALADFAGQCQEWPAAHDADECI